MRCKFPSKIGVRSESCVYHLLGDNPALGYGLLRYVVCQVIVCQIPGSAPEVLELVEHVAFLRVSRASWVA